MQRFYYPTLNNLEIISVKDKNEIFHQLTKVLRSKIGDDVIFFDGNNYIDHIYTIDSIEKNNIILKLKEKITKNSENNINLNLYQSLPNKQEKIEFIIQKGVEIGYNNFYFFKSDRSQNIKITENKIERFKKIIIEASEQSGRNIVPQLFFIEKLSLENIKGENLYFHTDKTKAKKLKELDIKSGKINIFVGPEGGFSEKETKIFEKNNLTKINLGDYILRTETTGIVVGFYLMQS
ncbi:MAG: RsmE family RNA methyltransferase [Candidatus Gracilibacteria bacterium]|nr:RsmE family RNA methyltransferase [Candidatus Gracilibacteria bacterium]